jgi:hypothetical protein
VVDDLAVAVNRYSSVDEFVEYEESAVGFETFEIRHIEDSDGCEDGSCVIDGCPQCSDMVDTAFAGKAKFDVVGVVGVCFDETGVGFDEVGKAQFGR